MNTLALIVFAAQNMEWRDVTDLLIIFAAIAKSA